MNYVCISGNLVREPEVKYSQNGTAYLINALAFKRNNKSSNGEYECDFFNINAFENNAEYIGKYCKKGQKIIVSGALQTNSYQGTDGKTKTSTFIKVSSIETINVGSRSENKEKKKEEQPLQPEWGNGPDLQTLNIDDLSF